MPENIMEQSDGAIKKAVFKTSGQDTARMFPTSMSFKCSLSDVALLIARIAAADATA